MTLQYKMISILVHILVFKLHCASGSESVESNTEVADAEENRIIRPSGFAFRHITNRRPEIVYFAEQTTYKVDTVKDSKRRTTTPYTTTTTTSTTTTTTPRPFVKSKLRKIVKWNGSSESESVWSFPSHASNEESSKSKSDDSGESSSKSIESESESVESNESTSNKSSKPKKPSKASATSSTSTTSTTTTTARPVTFPPNTSKKYYNSQPAIFNQLPGPPVIRTPGYQTYEPYAEDHLIRPPPHYRQRAPYGFVIQSQPSKGFPSYYRPRQNAPFIFNNPLAASTGGGLGNGLAGFFRFPVYRKFYVASQPKEPPPQPPPHNFHHPPAKKPDPPKKHDKSKEVKEADDGSSEEKSGEKESLSEEEEENYSRDSHSAESAQHSETKDGSDEKDHDKSTSYKVHESHEKKDSKKYDDKGGSEKAGHKHGHKSSEKKDKGAHDSVESGFMKEEGVKFNHENRKRKGFNSDKGYKNTEHFGKGNKGEYDEEKNSDFKDKQHNKKESKHEDAKEYGQSDHKYRDDKGDEYKKVHAFCDDLDEEGKHNKFGDEHEEYDRKKGDSEEGGKNDAGHKHSDHSTNDHLKKRQNSDENQTWSSKNSRSKGYSEDKEYNKEGGHKRKKHKDHSWK